VKHCSHRVDMSVCYLWEEASSNETKMAEGHPSKQRSIFYVLVFKISCLQTDATE